MGSLGMQEIIVIFIIALIVFGPRKLPEIGKSIGKGLQEFKRASNDLKRTWEEEVQLEKEKESISSILKDTSDEIKAATDQITRDTSSELQSVSDELTGDSYPELPVASDEITGDASSELPAVSDEISKDTSESTKEIQ